MDKARQLLTNANWSQKDGIWVKNINGKDHTLKLSILVCKDNEEKLKVAENIKNDLSDFGIVITINKVDWNTYISNLNNSKFDLAIASFETQTDFDIVEMIKKDNTNHFAKYDNEAVNSMLKDFDLSNIYLKEKFEGLQLKYKEEVPYIGLYFKTNVLLTNKSVKGEYKSTSYNPYRNMINFYK